MTHDSDYESNDYDFVGNHDFDPEEFVEKLKTNLDDDSIEVLGKLVKGGTGATLKKIEAQLERMNKSLESIKESLNLIAHKR